MNDLRIVSSTLKMTVAVMMRRRTMKNSGIARIFRPFLVLWFSITAPKRSCVWIYSGSFWIYSGSSLASSVASFAAASEASSSASLKIYFEDSSGVYFATASEASFTAASEASSSASFKTYFEESSGVYFATASEASFAAASEASFESFATSS